MKVIDKRGKEYELEINNDGTVNIFSEEGQNCNVEVSGNALWMLKNGDCEYPLDVVVLCQDLVQIKMRSSAC